jgi:WhiB family redox-sensing transcriptional regulator
MAVWDGAVCADMDPEVFFPSQGRSSAEAMEACASCPVTELCRETFGPIVDYGVVGGQTAEERRLDRMRRRRAGEPAA